MRVLVPSIVGWLVEGSGSDLPIVRIASGAAAAASLLFFLTPEHHVLFISVAVLSLFWAAPLPLVEAITLRCLEHRSHHYGRIRLWGSIGFIVAVLAVGAWLSVGRISDLLWINSMMLVGLALAAALVRDTQPLTGHRRIKDRLWNRLDREVKTLLLAGFFMAAAHGPFYVFFSIHLVSLGYGELEVGALWSLGVVAEIFVFYAMPRILKRLDLRHVLLTTYLLAVTRFVLIGWGAEYLACLVVAQVLHGATFGACHAAAVAMLNKRFPAHQQAGMQGLYGSIAYGAGGMFGNLESGMAWELWGPEIAFTTGSVLALLAVAVAFVGWQPKPVKAGGL